MVFSIGWPQVWLLKYFDDIVPYCYSETGKLFRLEVNIHADISIVENIRM